MDSLNNNQNQQQIQINQEDEILKNEKRKKTLKILFIISIILVGLTFVGIILEFMAGLNGYLVTNLVLCTVFFGLFDLIYVLINCKTLKAFKTFFILNIIMGLLVGVLPIGIAIYRRVTTPSYIPSIDKPIIYLYPEEETEISVKLNNKDNITCSYPKYIDGWNVVAKPNGDLTYVEDGKKLYSLYYESENEKNYKVEEDGFVVKGEDTAEFLEEKLEILGLNYKEKEEFIVYWLPKLEANKYNYIRFATMDEINQNMKLEFSKKPDTLIRVLMTYKGLDKEIEVKEQKLETPERKGFVAVEWGGSEIK